MCGKRNRVHTDLVSVMTLPAAHLSGNLLFCIKMVSLESGQTKLT